MGKKLVLSAVAIASLAILGSCAGGSASVQNGDQSVVPQLMHKPEVPKGAAMFSDYSPDHTYALVTPSNESIGTVQVTNDTQKVRVYFDLDGSLAMSSSQVYVGTSAPESDDPLSFPNTTDHSQAQNTYTYDILLSGLDTISTLYVSAHAVTSKGVAVWAGQQGQFSGLVSPTKFDPEEVVQVPVGTDLGPANVSGKVTPPSVRPSILMTQQTDPAEHYFTVNVMPVFEPVLDWKGYTAYFGSTPSTWAISFSSSEWLPVPAQESFPGWCVDQTHMMYTGIEYKIQAYSCYDSHLPAFADSANWDMISYLITQRNNNQSSLYGRDWSEQDNIDNFQRAIWYFKGGAGLPSPNTLARSLVEDALDHGDSFVPGPGEFQAVILVPDTATNDPTERAQENIIEAPVFETF